MPVKPQWWQHIPAIRSMLADMRLPVIDRAAVESLFGLRRRQADRADASVWRVSGWAHLPDRTRAAD